MKIVYVKWPSREFESIKTHKTHLSSEYVFADGSDLWSVFKSDEVCHGSFFYNANGDRSKKIIWSYEHAYLECSQT